MEIQYGKTDSYKHQLDKEKLNWLTDRTIRSNGQTIFMFQLVDGDFERLKQLEMNIKNCFYFGCPADKETVNEILEMQPKNKWFIL